jgi:subtilisin family serine protease
MKYLIDKVMTSILIAATTAVGGIGIATPAHAIGSVTTQGDQAMRSDIARQSYGVDGRGVTVGILSNSFNLLAGNEFGIPDYAADIASGDLPANINVLQDAMIPPEFGGPGCPLGRQGDCDEIRAIAQIIYDIAPGVNFVVHSAPLIPNQVEYANALQALADNGAQIIVSDVGYPFFNDALEVEPYFQDGIINQTIDQLVASGITYFSSAGNENRHSYQNDFNPSGITNLGGIDLGGELHNFNLDGPVDAFQQIIVPAQRGVSLTFQWDDPVGAVTHDLDLLLFDESGNLIASSANDNIAFGLPLENVDIGNPDSTDKIFDLAILKKDGSDSSLPLMKYIYSGQATFEYDTQSPTIVGNPNAEGAIAVGAVDYRNTPAFGIDPAILEPFSSAGCTPITLAPDGSRLAEPECRSKPAFVAPDNVNTTFFSVDLPDAEGDGFPNFRGTSAAAPHAAGVAALLLQANPNLSPSDIFNILAETALPIPTPGLMALNTGNFNFDAGYGLIQADQALAEVVPEPSLSLGLLGLGALGAISRLKKKDNYRD